MDQLLQAVHLIDAQIADGAAPMAEGEADARERGADQDQAVGIIALAVAMMGSAARRSALAS